MTNKLKGELMILPDIKMNVELTAQHLIDMQVSNTEEGLIAAEEMFIAELDVLDKKVRAETNKRRAIVDALVSIQEKAVDKAVTPVLRKIGAKHVGTDASHSESQTGNSLKISIVIGPEARKNVDVTGSLTIHKLVRIPKTVKKIDEKLAALSKERNQTMNNLQRIKLDLSNIPRIERKARAALAQKTLESTVAGKKFAAQLNKQPLLAPPS